MSAPHWKFAVAGLSFGLTVPLRVAVENVMAVAGSVVTVGAAGPRPVKV